MTSVAIVLYDHMTALDAVGPMEVLRFLPGVEIKFVAQQPGPIRTDSGLQLVADASFDEVPNPEVVLIPGGPGTEQQVGGALVDWLRSVHPQATWTTSVCSGSLILAAAGILDGGVATSHFGVLSYLELFGVTGVSERVVIDEVRQVISSAGVAAGIDMALVLAQRLSDETTARAIQLLIEYDPDPPFDSGSIATASDAVVARAVELGKPVGALPADYSPGAPPAGA